MMIITAAPVGHSAAYPGKTVETCSTSPHATRATSPIHPSATRTACGTRSRGSTIARMPPSASSHSRAPVSKYAHGWFSAVRSTEYVKETANTTPLTARNTASGRRRVRVASTVDSASSSGQIR